MEIVLACVNGEKGGVKSVDAEVAEEASEATLLCEDEIEPDSDPFEFELIVFRIPKDDNSFVNGDIIKGVGLPLE